MTNSPSPAEFFGWARHPFSDSYPLSAPFLSGIRTNESLHRLLPCFPTVKAWPSWGLQAQENPLCFNTSSPRLDPNYYRPIMIHYGGLMRNGLLKAVADHLGVETNTRSLPLLVKLQKHHPGNEWGAQWPLSGHRRGRCSATRARIPAGSMLFDHQPQKENQRGILDPGRR